ncbi:TonB-dependent receptor [uncultured Desulfobacter sp.]|uniref:TonB-dependent receptor n=1 Tax=uncultured Desulfobacter sp. TaxID=240139 RepID=UPI0029F4A14B|nr:TonB-dependent receptor [uncultured Desulfobacter sp.]
MNLSFKPMIFLGTAILLFSAHLPAFAGQTLKDQSEPSETLETITVTAQKTEENIQEVPISMSVFDEFTLEDRNIDNLEDIAQYTPGLQIFSKSAVKSSPSLRGLHSSDRNPTAGLYIDGAPITGGIGFDETLLDIERIEVLKGPQGTLYGKNAQVGVVNIITKKPTNETQGKIKGSLGSDSKRDISMNLSGALVEDTFYVGVAAKHYEKDGFVKSTTTGKIVDDREHDYGKINFRWTPTDNLEASLVSSKTKYDNGDMSFGLTSENDREVGNDYEGYVKSEIALTSLNVKYDFSEAFSITSITAYRDYKDLRGFDWDYSNNDATRWHAVDDNRFKTYSEELRVNYENDKIQLVSGIYLEKSDFHYDQENDKGWLSSIQNISKDIDGDTMGIFSHLTYDLSEKLSLIGGLRFGNEKLTYEDSTETIDYDEDDICPKIGLTYDLLKDLMSYVTISKGYRGGGFNTGAPDGYSKSFDKETLWSYEVGLKGTILDNRLMYDIAVYYMDIDDMQVSEYVTATSAITTNAAKATSQGIEASLNFQATDTINLFAGASYVDIKFDEYNNGKVDYSGNKKTYAPEYNFNIGVTYRAEQGFYASADITGYGDMQLDIANKYKRDAYEIVNAKIGYEQKNYDIYLYAKNLFDKKYDSIGFFNGVYTQYSPLREIGVILTYRL